MQIADYLVLNPRAKFINFTTKILTSDAASEDPVNATNVELSNLQFPALPQVALQILQLSINKDHSAKELAELVAQDPVMQQQVTLYTQLPFIQEKLQASIQPQDANLQEVVEHILGFEMVSHIALGVAAGRVFNQERIHDLEDFWRHAFFAAIYAERISELVAERLEVDPAISYLAGLFHNFGLLLICQMFPPEYSLLKKWLALNPKVSISVLEKRLLGMGQAMDVLRGGHAQLGEWLLRSWQMPESICVITKEHHSLTYKGKYAHYVRIIQLTNQLLRVEGIGDGTIGGVTPQLLESLGLTEQEIYQAIEPIKANAAGLEKMARTLTKSK